jgi:hypothetical protein
VYDVFVADGTSPKREDEAVRCDFERALQRSAAMDPFAQRSVSKNRGVSNARRCAAPATCARSQLAAGTDSPLGLSDSVPYR